ncbi:MAG: outer membrane beta-barrel protein [Steroidobacteraceae bacterium]
MQRTMIGMMWCAVGTVGLAQTAAADTLTGLYVGGNYGAARNEYQTSFVDDQYQQAAMSAGDSLDITTTSVRRSGDTWWVDAGYMPWVYVGFDAAFFHLPELTHRTSGTLQTAIGGEPIVTTATVTSRGPAVSLVARVPLTESLELGMRVGDYFGKTTLTTGLELNSTYSSSPQSASKSSLLVGIGGAYTFAGHWSLRLDYLRFDHAGDSRTVGTFSMNMATAGVAFTF